MPGILGGQVPNLTLSTTMVLHLHPQILAPAEGKMEQTCLAHFE